MRTLTLISLGFGLASVGTLFLAIATDYWLFTSEPVDFESMILGGEPEVGLFICIKIYFSIKLIVHERAHLYILSII